MKNTTDIKDIEHILDIKDINDMCRILCFNVRGLQYTCFNYKKRKNLISHTPNSTKEKNNIWKLIYMYNYDIPFYQTEKINGIFYTGAPLVSFRIEGCSR